MFKINDVLSQKKKQRQSCLYYTSPDYKRSKRSESPKNNFKGNEPTFQVAPEKPYDPEQLEERQADGDSAVSTSCPFFPCKGKKNTSVRILKITGAEAIQGLYYPANSFI